MLAATSVAKPRWIDVAESPEPGITNNAKQMESQELRVNDAPQDSDIGFSGSDSPGVRLIADDDDDDMDVPELARDVGLQSIGYTQLPDLADVENDLPEEVTDVAKETEFLSEFQGLGCGSIDEPSITTVLALAMECSPSQQHDGQLQHPRSPCAPRFSADSPEKEADEVRRVDDKDEQDHNNDNKPKNNRQAPGKDVRRLGHKESRRASISGVGAIAHPGNPITVEDIGDSDSESSDASAGIPPVAHPTPSSNEHEGLHLVPKKRLQVTTKMSNGHNRTRDTNPDDNNALKVISRDSLRNQPHRDKPTSRPQRRAIDSATQPPLQTSHKTKNPSTASTASTSVSAASSPAFEAAPGAPPPRAPPTTPQPPPSHLHARSESLLETSMPPPPSGATTHRRRPRNNIRDLPPRQNIIPRRGEDDTAESGNPRRVSPISEPEDEPDENLNEESEESVSSGCSSVRRRVGANKPTTTATTTTVAKITRTRTAAGSSRRRQRTNEDEDDDEFNRDNAVIDSRRNQVPGSRGREICHARVESRPDRSELSRHVGVAIMPRRAPQSRSFWPDQDIDILIDAIGRCGARWSMIAKDTKWTGISRSQEQVRDKARNLKVNFLCNDLALPDRFDEVLLPENLRARIRAMGRNPDRSEADYDHTRGIIQNHML